MTREQKLALIVGFALVLFVGVLLSDHLSGANRSLGTEGQVAALGDRLTPEADPGFGAAFELQAPSTAPRKAEPPRERTVRTTPAQPPRTTPSQPESQPTRQFAFAPESAPAETSGQRQARLEDRFKTVAEGAVGLLRDSQDNPVAAQLDPPSRTLEMGAPPRGADRATMREPERETRGAGRPTTKTPRSQWPVHRVAKGESLWSIAEQHYGDGKLHTRLAKINEGRVGKEGAVFVGASILIPPAEELGVVAITGVSPKAEPAKPKPTATASRTYTVRSGDTLSEISQKLLGTSKRWREIRELNAKLVDDNNQVRVGDTLRIPAR